MIKLEKRSKRGGYVVETKLKYLSVDDINKSRKEVDSVYEIYRRGSQFSDDDLREALEKVIEEASEHTDKASSPSS
jgi:hypothetical protein